MDDQKSLLDDISDEQLYYGRSLAANKKHPIMSLTYNPRSFGVAEEGVLILDVKILYLIPGKLSSVVVLISKL